MDEYEGGASPAQPAGPWHGLRSGDWHARFVRDVDLTDVVIRSSFRVRMHEGAVPIVADAAAGPSRGAAVTADAMQPLVRRGVA